MHLPWILLAPAGHDTTHDLLQPSPSCALPSSHSSLASVTPSPQNGLRHTERQTFGSLSEFAFPTSHSSADSMTPLPHTLIAHFHVHPSRSSAFPSSQASPGSRTPSPQNARRQLVRHALGTRFEFAVPSSHSSESSTAPLPQNGRMTASTVQKREHPSPLTRFPSSHASGAWIHPSPQTLRTVTDDADDDASGCGGDSDAGTDEVWGSGGAADEAAGTDCADEAGCSGGATLGTDDAAAGGATDDDEGFATAGTDDGTELAMREDDEEGVAAGADDAGTEEAGTADERTDERADDDEEDDDDEGFDEVHDTMVHLHVSVVHTLPHDGCEAAEPVPASHSSPMGRLTIASPQRGMVQVDVQSGPVPLREP